MNNKNFCTWIKSMFLFPCNHICNLRESWLFWFVSLEKFFHFFWSQLFRNFFFIFLKRFWKFLHFFWIKLFNIFSEHYFDLFPNCFLLLLLNLLFLFYLVFLILSFLLKLLDVFILFLLNLLIYLLLLLFVLFINFLINFSDFWKFSSNSVFRWWFCTICCSDRGSCLLARNSKRTGSNRFFCLFNSHWLNSSWFFLYSFWFWRR